MSANILSKIYEVRAGRNSLETEIYDNNEFFNTMFDYINANSKLLNQSKIVMGNPKSLYAFSVEDDANVVELLEDSNYQIDRQIGTRIELKPKMLGVQVSLHKRPDQLEEKEETEILKNVLYNPFLKKIEKNIIHGNYFNSSLFNTDNIISGSGFSGLMDLTEVLKVKNDDTMIVGHNAIIDAIIQRIPADKSAYLNEYLLKGTINGVPIISTINAPANDNGKILVGFNPAKLCLLLSTDLSVRKVNSLGLVYYYQFYTFINGGDIFNSSIALKI
jgi:putative ubiquitin-RnfH superfamily antitoxin RatB of RatAB toxin-antitoxin module